MNGASGKLAKDTPHPLQQVLKPDYQEDKWVTCLSDNTLPEKEKKKRASLLFNFLANLFEVPELNLS